MAQQAIYDCFIIFIGFSMKNLAVCFLGGICYLHGKVVTLSIFINTIQRASLKYTTVLSLPANKLRIPAADALLNRGSFTNFNY